MSLVVKSMGQEDRSRAAEELQDNNLAQSPKRRQERENMEERGERERERENRPTDRSMER